ncbi:hypothetical protein D9613_003700 [Agrocybe pediades]|uniref:Pali-domain-containing protein n=1 Tax=Agrocybe pediades TaxID=84607 RepID=A0A8H4VJV1_9AGAR|nr:hypothetical protein D9613_003700 [Agrocybe pediades]
MSRIFCIPGIVFLAIAFTFHLLVSISLPSFRTIDIVRINVGLSNNFESVDLGNIRLGIWTYCVYGEPNGNNICAPAGLGYSVPLGPAGGEIQSSWTKGLAMHPLATAFTFVALLLSLSTHLTVTLLASLVSFFAALLTLIAFSIDIALLLLTRDAINEDFPSGITNFIHTNTEAGKHKIPIILGVQPVSNSCFDVMSKRALEEWLY